MKREEGVLTDSKGLLGRFAIIDMQGARKANMNRCRAAFKRSVGFIITVFVILGTFNLLVDPYAIHGTPHIPRLNDVKPHVALHLRMTKAFAVSSIRPAGLVLGSSRAEQGIDPDHPGWDLAARPCYNLSLVSASIYEIRKYLDHALSAKWSWQAQPVRQVVIGLDFFMFNGRRAASPDFREERLSTRSNRHAMQESLHEMLVTLFTLDAFRNSLDTVRASAKGEKVRAHLPNGAMVPDFASATLLRKGHRAASLEIERKYQAEIDDFTFRDGTGRSTIDDFRDIVRMARQQKIDLRLFISPVHVRMLEVKKMAGLWDFYERWKRDMVKVLVEDAAANPGAQPFPLWDFSGYNGVTTEEVPGKPGGTMMYYRESSHYNRKAGNIVLNRIFGVGTVPVPDFGVLVTDGNIERHLAMIRQKQVLWEQRHLREVAEIAVNCRDAVSERR